MKRLLKKAHTFAHYAKKEGLRSTVRRTKQSLANKSVAVQHPQQQIFIMAEVEDIIRANYVKNPYKKPKRLTSKKRPLKIGWILSPLSHGSGGQNTITRFVRHLNSKGHTNIIYLYEGIHPQAVSEAKSILKNSFYTVTPVKKIDSYKNDECDIIFATGWETAYPLFNLRTKAPKFYFVQDFEPYFYATGSLSVLAENTYKFGFHGITAGRWLTHKLSTEYGMTCDFFDFGADFDRYKMRNDKERKVVCFYARPVTERRAFELGIIALAEFHKHHPDYEIHMFGWDVGNYKIPFDYVNRGILNHEELAELYNQSTACLVLSLTNVSLLPLELLAAGCIPVMNDGDNNRMVLGHNDFIKYSGNSPAELADALDEVVSMPQKEQLKRATGASQSVANRSWDDAGDAVEKAIYKELYGK